MAAAVSARGTLSPLGTVEADIEDSNVSSPLSEVEDGDANDDDIQHMQIDDQNDADHLSAGGDEELNDNGSKIDRSESESALSEAGFDENSEASDTEAETERLYDTPRNQRQRDVVVDQYNQGKVFEHTPSKPRSASRLVDDDDLDRDDDSMSDVGASVASADDSPTKPAASNDTSIDGENKQESQERKRKRLSMADQSELDGPMRKRPNSVGATEPDLTADTPTNDDDTALGNTKSGNQFGGENKQMLPVHNDGITDCEQLDKEKLASKKVTRNGSKREVGSSNNTPAGTPRQDVDGDEAEIADDDDIEQRHEEVEAEVDEHDAAAKSIEEAERKSAAFRDWSHIEEMFVIFRDRLYKDRLQRIEEEEQSLLANLPTHPEFLNMKQCLDDRLERKVQEINAECALRLEAHERRAVAIRAQVWSQFFQAVRERREAALESLNRQWYEIQTARRSAHSLPDYGLLFPKDQIRRVKNAIAYNTEVSTLAGLAKYEGFPAGPELKGASISEVEADFSAIEKVRRGRQKPMVSARDDYPTPTFARLGPAGEQFIKDTPWANPHHSSHKMHQQFSKPASHAHRLITEVASAAEEYSAASLEPTLKTQTPVIKSLGLAARTSESPELSRSIIGPAAHQMKLVSGIPNVGRGSKAAAI